MAREDVVYFFQKVSKNAFLLDKFRDKVLKELVAEAKNMGYEFTEIEISDVVWEMEIFLAKKRGEQFGPMFSLWRTMWGKNYFQYVIDNVIESLSVEEMQAVATKVID
ncbi:MAG: Nif11 family protein [Trichodesmium sp. MAG_R04]|nr:Nif11 family protein [Trichodesmium sp. MAG_R04]